MATAPRSKRDELNGLGGATPSSSAQPRGTGSPRVNALPHRRQGDVGSNPTKGTSSLSAVDDRRMLAVADGWSPEAEFADGSLLTNRGARGCRRR